MNYIDESGLKQGYWESYYCIDDDNFFSIESKNASGCENVLCSKGHYIDNLKHGYWEEYYDNGNIMSKINYKMGEVILDGYCLLEGKELYYL